MNRLATQIQQANAFLKAANVIAGLNDSALDEVEEMLRGSLLVLVEEAVDEANYRCKPLTITDPDLQQYVIDYCKSFEVKTPTIKQ